ncbi:11-beta-hydroxysteroid dehydrogenase type 2 isoform X2 [Corythoichthys intestinalis]|uniref:11-beta-hydroxysteroid dehydrogenase type 2 isoform X2 n=1 Tax=Corythoichthys intestinalis TaxID=161448 RepID=UPI0025A504AF|nr:11-beta-hydroxysteroid dehydrogenase type 2-like isoform X2 [Corythoichthys intestinalis]XP_061796700.1 11-beta-hydroxysteroid dehydrogenase type 2-like [Nerophis lumbriciformis]
MDEWGLVCWASVLGAAALAWRLLLLIMTSSPRAPRLLPVGDKVVVITGCDSGFGKATARHLDSLGFRVFATVLDADGEGALELRRTCSERLALLQLDITQPEQVRRALAQVGAQLGPRGLWAVVNNAGVCVNFGDIELSQMSNFRGCMEVNFFGTLDVTKTFLPLLRRHKGRLVTVSSPAGDQPFPCLAAYGASKAALNLFMDTLRQELAPWGVHVSTILPSSYKTGRCSDAAYWEARHRELLASLPPELLDDFGIDYVGETKELFQCFARHANPDLSPVVDAMERALLEPRPQARYFAGPGVGLMYLVSAYFPAPLRNRFLESLFVKKRLAPRALREESVGVRRCHDDNNNREASKVK